MTYNFSINDFEGPLDLLLHLIKENKMHWFTQDRHVLTEQEFLGTTGKVLRPDRIMMDNQHAIVIDYKFGHIKEKKYVNKMRKYAQLLIEMGYTVETYIVYIALQEIERIQ